jgi:hypothetical protein
MPHDALWIWGRLRDFERDGFQDKSAAELLGSMTAAMVSDVMRIAPMMRDFLSTMVEVNDEIDA